MNTRFCTVMTVATLVCLSTGCSGMRNFLFGRGARCGLCTKLGSCLPAPRFGNMMQAPIAAPTCQAPAYAPAPAPAYSPADAYAPNYAPAPSCGCNEYAGSQYGQESHSSGMCGTCGDSFGPQNYGSEIYDNGNYGMNGYGMGTVDPYMNQPSGSTLVPGQQINGETVVGVGPVGNSPNYPSGTSYPAAPSYNGGPVQSDNFQSRKFDTDGNKIIYEEPLPPGTKAL